MFEENNLRQKKIYKNTAIQSESFALTGSLSDPMRARLNKKNTADAK